MGHSSKQHDLEHRLEELLTSPWEPEQTPFPEPAGDPIPEQKPSPEEPKPELPPEEPLPEEKPAPAPVIAGWKTEAMLLLQGTLTVLAVLLVVLTFCFRTALVRGESMEPALYQRDFLLLRSNLLYTPQRGDVVVFRAEDYAEEPLIKRVIGLPGDTVDIDFEAGTVLVNGTVLEEPYLRSSTHRDFGEEGVEFPLEVQPDCVFVLGDNRNNSNDSRCRAIGQVPCGSILGKALLVLWPGSGGPGRIGLIGQ